MGVADALGPQPIPTGFRRDDDETAQVIAERLTERCEHFVLDGKTFRPTPAA